MNNREIAELLYERVCGTPDDLMQVIDQMIEDHEITIEHYRQNEMDILGHVDNMMFNCARCGWNVDICDMSTESSNMADLICVDCEDES